MTTVTISNMPLVIRLAKNEISTTESWLYQARRAFSDCTPEQMLQPIHGTSGRSRAGIIAGYQERCDHARQLLSELEYSP